MQAGQERAGSEGRLCATPLASDSALTKGKAGVVGVSLDLLRLRDAFPRRRLGVETCAWESVLALVDVAELGVVLCISDSKCRIGARRGSSVNSERIVNAEGDGGQGAC